MSVTNDLEQIVPVTVDRLLTGHDHIQTCAPCRDDVIALTLSKLHPGYSSSDMGRILKRIDAEKARERARVAVAVVAAIAVVEKSPHHTG